MRSRSTSDSNGLFAELLTVQPEVGAMLSIEELQMLVGKNLRGVRRGHEPPMTQAELARRSRVSRSAIAAIEHGRRMPRGETLVKLASSLGVDPSKFFEGAEWNVSAGHFESTPRPPRASERE